MTDRDDTERTDLEAFTGDARAHLGQAEAEAAAAMAKAEGPGRPEPALEEDPDPQPAPDPDGPPPDHGGPADPAEPDPAVA